MHRALDVEDISMHKILAVEDIFMYRAYTVKYIYMIRVSAVEHISMYRTINNSRTGLDTSKNQCSAPAVTALKNY